MINRHLLFAAALFLTIGCDATNDFGIAESAVVSTDPCGAQLPWNPSAPACTKAGKTSWVCKVFSTTLNHCVKAAGTTPIPGTEFVFGPTPPSVIPYGHAVIWPAWDDTPATLPNGNQGVMQVPANTQVATFAALLPSGWSYATGDLVPGDVQHGLTAMHWDYIQLHDGAGICIYRSDNFTNELGCWHASAGGYVLVEPYLYGDVAIHSFYTFYD